MHVTITKLSNVKDDKGGVLVEFSSGIGNAIGWWKTKAPILAREYDVEFDIDGKLIWGTSIVGTTSDETLIKCDNELIVIQGELTSIDDDGVCYLNLQGSLFMVATEGQPMALGTYAKITVPRLYIYDTGT